MNGDLRNDELLRSYLLGELPEEEVDRLERRLIEDDELFDLCEALEADLLAACDRGELTAAGKEQVLRRLASSPAGQRRFALARSLNTAAREPQRITAPPLPFRRRVPLPRRASGWATLAAAAALLVVLGRPGRDNIPQQPPPETVQQPPPETVQQPPPETVQPPPPETVQPPPPETVQPPPPEPQPRPEPVKSVLTLSLTTPMRGAEDVEDIPELRIQPGAEFVEIKADLQETGLEEYKSFHAAVRQGNATVWEEEGLAPQRVAWDKDTSSMALVLEIPVQRFTTGRYKLVVIAGTEELTQDFEVVGESQ